MKFDIGELVYDPRHRKVGMVKTIKDHGDDGIGIQYGIHFFDDSYCAEGNTRHMSLGLAADILERYESNCSPR
jgi:hypothetical protein